MSSTQRPIGQRGLEIVEGIPDAGEASAHLPGRDQIPASVADEEHRARRHAFRAENAPQVVGLGRGGAEDAFEERLPAAPADHPAKRRFQRRGVDVQRAPGRQPGQTSGRAGHFRTDCRMFLADGVVRRGEMFDPTLGRRLDRESSG